MIVDDEAVRVGSANMNNRSLGLDSECDVLISTTVAANAASGQSIRAFHYGLLSEHLRVDATTIAAKIRERGSLIAAIEELRGGVKTLCPYQTPDLAAVEEWLAENDVLGSGGTDEPFEPLARRTLFRRSNRSSR